GIPAKAGRSLVGAAHSRRACTLHRRSDAPLANGPTTPRRRGTMDSSIVVMLIAGVMATYAAKMLFVYFRMRGARIVVCPETRQPAVVSVDAGHSAVGAAFNSPDLR